MKNKKPFWQFKDAADWMILIIMFAVIVGVIILISLISTIMTEGGQCVVNPIKYIEKKENITCKCTRDTHTLGYFNISSEILLEPSVDPHENISE